MLRLSDAFQQGVEPGTFEWTAIMVNINDGHNRALMERCRPLKEYSVFVGRVRDYTPEMGLDAAVDRAVNECIREGILSDFLATHKAEVIDVVLTEYNEKAVLDAIAKENRAEGFSEKGILVYKNMIRRGFSREEARIIADLSDEEAAIAESQMRTGKTD